MASLKRNWEEMEDSDDDDEPMLGRQILPVADLPEDFADDPKDGLEYLFTVRRDAQKLPHITRVPNPYETTTLPPSPTDNRVIPEHITLPSEEWRKVFATRIKNFRKNVRQPTIHVAFTPGKQHARVIPDKKDRDLWWSFLAGKPESEWNPPKRTKQTAVQRLLAPSRSLGGPTEHESQQHSWQANGEANIELVYDADPYDSLPTPMESPAASDTKGAGPSTEPAVVPGVYKPQEPTPSILSLIDEKTTLHLLMYFTHWINLYLRKRESSLQPLESHARWIFALLSKVEDYVSADDMNLLRNLVRACSALLKELLQAQGNSEEESGDSSEAAEAEASLGYMKVRSCWIIISTVADVWAQHDLWTDAEELLKSLGSKTKT